MADKFYKQITTLDSPASDGFTITPSDNTVFTQTSRSLYVGTGGTVTLLTTSNTVLSFTNVASGQILPIRATKVFANTTASNIIGLF